MKLYNKALAVLGLTLVTASITACGSKDNDDTPKDVTTDVSNTATNEDNKKDEKIGLSSIKYDIDKEFYYSDYNDRVKDKGYKIFDKKDDIVFDNISYEELIYLLESKGNHLILFGGSWCGNTQASIGYINELANLYGIDTIYNFDFRIDGDLRNTHIRETNGSTQNGATYNYLYGELVSKYLPNLTDWVEYKTDSQSALTYTDSKGVDITVAKAQVPFLFLYNKDNTVNNSNTSSSSSKYPIVYGFEEMVNRDEKGVYTAEYNEDYTIKSKTYITDEYKNRLKGIFEYIKANNITLANYTYSDYIKESFNDKAGTQLFEASEKVNINTVSYRELKWLLEQEGDSIILLGGSWCGNTRAIINIVNDYAIKNDVIVYIYDTKIDSGISKSKFGYTIDLNTRATGFNLVNLYTDLIENYLTNIVTLYDKEDGLAGHKIDYIDKEGKIVSVAKAQVPYLLAYNKDAKDSLGLSTPIRAYYEEMLTLSDNRLDYVYKKENYDRYSNATKEVFKAYAKGAGINIEDIIARETV